MTTMIFTRSMKLYWPKTGLDVREGDIVGWERGENLVIAALLPSAGPSTSPFDGDSVNQLKCLGRAYRGDKETRDEIREAGLTVWLSSKALPIASSNPNTQVILYTPPDHRRLRFLSLDDRGGEDRCSPYLARQDEYSVLGETQSVEEGSIEDVLPLMNQVLAVQISLRANKPPIHLAPDPPGQATEGGEEVERVRTNHRIYHYSAIVRQVLLRWEQVIALPRRFRQIIHDPQVPLRIRSKRYMGFWNTVWLVFNDLLLGQLARQFILQSESVIGHYITSIFMRYTIELPLGVLTWLDNWPIGLKLNTPLSTFFCSFLSTLIVAWSNLIGPILQAHMSIMINLLLLSSSGGLTLLITTIQDCLHILSSHLHLCYILTSTICTWQLVSLGALWNLFRGKRWNVLRQRTDSYAYNVDQLFLGTLLFTVSIFLLPTVAIYAGFFYGIHRGIKLVDKTLGLIVIALNAFPLFEIMLRLKEPSRLPAGINFTVVRTIHNARLPSTAFPIPAWIQLKVCFFPKNPLSFDTKTDRRARLGLLAVFYSQRD